MISEIMLLARPKSIVPCRGWSESKNSLLDWILPINLMFGITSFAFLETAFGVADIYWLQFWRVTTVR